MMKSIEEEEEEEVLVSAYTYTHTHTHTYKYIYVREDDEEKVRNRLGDQNNSQLTLPRKLKRKKHTQFYRSREEINSPGRPIKKTFLPLHRSAMSTGVGMPSIHGPTCNTPLILSPTLAPIARVVKLNDLEDVLFCLNEKVVGRREEKFLFFVAACLKVVGDAVVGVVRDAVGLSTEDIVVVLVGAVTLQEENNNLAEGDDVSREISLKRIYFPTAWCYLFIILRGACVFKARRKSKGTCLMRGGRKREVFAFFRKRKKNKA